ncbi:MAG: hypothetical protein FWF25_06215 [Propionibacteriaceae bacterium]|nr:hypothetical protein [Propionibacteriaceae bacterium]
MIMQMITAKARAVIAVVALLVGVIAPTLSDELTKLGPPADGWLPIVNMIAAVAATFAGTTWLAHITPDPPTQETTP